MRAVSLIFCVLAVAGCALAANDRVEFSHWMRLHQKQYSSASEYSARFANWRATKARIARLNADARDTATYALNQFADMSVPEFRAMPCGVDRLADLKPKFGNFTDVISPMPTFKGTPPASFDWRSKNVVTPVKNQEQCGSCWAFSTVEMTESVWAIAGKQLVGLSEQQIVDCSQESDGCGGGWPQWAMKDLLQDSGGRMDTEQSYPYTAQNGQCSFKPSSVGATITGFKSYCTEQTQPCSETDMVSLLYNNAPLSICLDAAWMQSYTGGVANPQSCDPDQIDHCVVITGYGTENGTPFWTIRNSWGTVWGDNGYCKLIRGTGACGVNKVVNLAQV